MVAVAKSINPSNHAGLVQSMAQKLAGRGVPVEDLFQEGFIGLMEAAKRFDPDKGNRFSSYAVPYIRGYMLTLIGKQKKFGYPLQETPIYDNRKEIDQLISKVDLVDLIKETPLTETQREVLFLWLGVNNRPQCCREIGEGIGRTKQRVHQHLQQALDLVREHLVRRGIVCRLKLLRSWCKDN
jgi:RNA polymerase sigma factor (sigma-70 family)